MDRKLYYIQHYFDFKNAGSFLLVSFLGLFVVLAVILTAARIQTALSSRHHTGQGPAATLRQVRKKHFVFIESFYEMVFSSTSVLLFLSLYYILDEKIPAAAPYWENYQNILLLFFIMASVFATNWLDIVLVRLTHISTEQKASIRLLSSFYIVLILLYIRFVYQDTNYDTLILYFITLAVGRFLYFDFTWKDFLSTLSCLWGNLPLLVLMALYSAVICWYGFHEDFLLKSNGVIISTLIAHLFMDLSIFFLHHTKLLRFFIPSGPDSTSGTANTPQRNLPKSR